MAESILSLQNVSKSFGAVVASDKVDLDVRSGEIHALIGPNGAGKSTLIKQIAGELQPDEGDIRFNGESVSHTSSAARARLGLVRTFQISQLAMDLPVIRNVALAVLSSQGRVFRFFKPVMSDETLIEPAMDVLRQTGLGNAANRLVSELSHGERRRLEMALALAMKPKLFLLDEPMAGLGPEGTSELTQFLDRLRHTAPILLVEHDMEAVFSLADRITVLVYGRVIATGSVDEIRNDAAVRKAYLGDE